MRKLLNTLYVTNEQAYLCLDGENLVCKIEDKIAFRIPFLNIESIVCFSYIGCSPALMGKCVKNLIPISFMSNSGRFLAKVCGETKGNVFLRVAQIEKFNDFGVQLTQNTIATKIHNTIALIKRSMHDSEELRSDADILSVVEAMKKSIDRVYEAQSVEEIIGIEGSAAHLYFTILGKLNKNTNFEFKTRTKRPPLDPINAVLSFMYSMYTNEFASALEVVGLDSYLGFCHKLRSGRASLACDLVEETRCLVERFVLGLFNLKILNESDFETQITGAVFLNDDGRKKVLTKWQEKKRTDLKHPYLNQKIQFGLIPYVQSNLLAKYIRGEIEEYPTFISK